MHLKVDASLLKVSVRFNKIYMKIWRELFLEIMITYNNLEDEINEKLVQKENEFQTKENKNNNVFNVEQVRSQLVENQEIDYPEDLLVSIIDKKEEYYIAYDKLQKAQNDNLTSVIASNLELNKDKLIDIYKYNPFMKDNVKPPKSVFISYVHTDTAYRNESQKYLVNLERDNLINIWQDGKIEVGTDWNKEIKQQLDKANIVIMLISQSSIASQYVHEVE